MHSHKNFIIANWKMSLDVEQSVNLLKAVKNKISGKDAVHTVVCPSYTALLPVSEILKGTSIELGAQDCFWEERGAYTGEISPADLVKIGCKYVILGHSERRKYLGETNEMIHKKVRVAYQNGLTPVLCIGENWDERSSGKKDFTLIKQVTESLEGITMDSSRHLIMAYEPAWAISTSEGIEPEPEEIQYANEVIRHILIDLYSKDFVEKNVRIVYGGSVKGNNVESFLELPSVRGFLVGGAAQKVEPFLELVEAIS